MDLSDALDAISAAFFALLGIWAALDRRHWFLRFAVVSVFLFASLLVPAFEIVLEFGVLILLINAGVWLATARRNWPPRLSMESALLAMVVVAVLCAVAGALPSLDARTWSYCMSVAFGGAAIALGCVQLVFGSRRLLERILWFLGFVAVALGTIGVIEAIESLARGRGFALPLDSRTLADFGNEHGGAFLLGTGLIIAALMLARETRWFHNTAGEPEPVRWRLVGSRWTLSTLVTAIFAPLFLIFLRLLFPTPLPPIELPNPNGYDDIVAAGRMATQEELQKILAIQDVASLEVEVARLAPMYELIDQGLARPIVSPHYHPDENEQAREDTKAEWSALLSLIIRADLAWKKSVDEQGVEDLLKALRLGRSLDPSFGMNWTASKWAEPTFVQYVQLRLSKLDNETCRRLAKECIGYDTNRRPIETLKKQQRVLDDNLDWKNNLWNTLGDASGEDRYQWLERWRKSRSTQMRLLIVQLAIQARYRELRVRTLSLDQLTPDYLSEVPLDPFTGKRLLTKSGPGTSTTTIYSVGPDLKDDTLDAKQGARSDDQTATAPMGP